MYPSHSRVLPQIHVSQPLPGFYPQIHVSQPLPGFYPQTHVSQPLPGSTSDPCIPATAGVLPSDPCIPACSYSIPPDAPSRNRSTPRSSGRLNISVRWLRDQLRCSYVSGFCFQIEPAQRLDQTGWTRGKKAVRLMGGGNCALPVPRSRFLGLTEAWVKPTANRRPASEWSIVKVEWCIKGINSVKHVRGVGPLRLPCLP
jgi:hypothetical protein